MASSSLPIGWAFQKPRGGGTRYSSQVKDYLKARFDAGQDSGYKADPSQVAIDLRNTRTEDNNECSREMSGCQETKDSPTFQDYLC